MGKNKIEYNFEQAISKNELEKLIIGDDNYFVQDKEFGGHWPYGSYKKYIEEYLIENNNIFPIKVWESLENILNNSKDINIFLDFLTIYLHIYYNVSDYDLKSKRVTNTPSKFIIELSKVIKLNKSSLLIDKRGTGVEWHSKNGLWGSINKKLRIIKENGGVNFFPNELI